jgi:hypothetical protein
MSELEREGRCTKHSLFDVTWNNHNRKRYFGDIFYVLDNNDRSVPEPAVGAAEWE